MAPTPLPVGEVGAASTANAPLDVATGAADCDGDATSGCETDIYSDVHNLEIAEPSAPLDTSAIWGDVSMGAARPGNT